MSALPLTPIPPAASRRADPRRAQTLERLRAATVELAAEVGIDAMTIDDVALRAGVAKGTVYYNVRDKDELVRLAVVTGLSNLAAAIDLGTADPALTPEARLEALLLTLVRAVAVSPGTARLLFAEAWRIGRPWYVDLVAGRRAIEARIADVFRDTLPPRPGGPDPGLLATGLLAMAISTTLDEVAAGRRGDQELARHAAALVGLFRQGRVEVQG